LHGLAAALVAAVKHRMRLPMISSMSSPASLVLLRDEEFVRLTIEAEELMEQLTTLDADLDVDSAAYRAYSARLNAHAAALRAYVARRT
jgi:hypothetical protein